MLVVLVANGWVAALIMLGIVLAVQQIEGHALQPFLMGHAVSLHPVAVLLVVAAGAFAAGIVGALFAVPLAALINTVILYLNGHDKFPDARDRRHPRHPRQARGAGHDPSRRGRPRGRRDGPGLLDHRGSPAHPPGRATPSGTGTSRAGDA